MSLFLKWSKIVKNSGTLFFGNLNFQFPHFFRLGSYLENAFWPVDRGPVGVRNPFYPQTRQSGFFGILSKNDTFLDQKKTSKIIIFLTFFDNFDDFWWFLDFLIKFRQFWGPKNPFVSCLGVKSCILDIKKHQKNTKKALFLDQFGTPHPAVLPYLLGFRTFYIGYLYILYTIYSIYYI